MKKLRVFLAFVMALVFTQVALAGQVKIVVNGNTLSVNGEIVNGRTLVPVREIAEALGADVNWNSANNEVALTKSDADGNAEKVAMQIGSNVIKMNGKATDNLDVPPQIINGKMMIPVRAVSQCFGSDTSWDGSTKTVSIKVTLKNDDGEDPEMEWIKTKLAEDEAIDKVSKDIIVANTFTEWMSKSDIALKHLDFLSGLMAMAYSSPGDELKAGLYNSDCNGYSHDDLVYDLTGYDENKEGVQTVNGIRIKNENGEVYFNRDDLVSKGIITLESYEYAD